LTEFGTLIKCAHALSVLSLPPKIIMDPGLPGVHETDQVSYASEAMDLPLLGKIDHESQT
jgi:hypothetical protein